MSGIASAKPIYFNCFCINELQHIFFSSHKTNLINSAKYEVICHLKDEIVYFYCQPKKNICHISGCICFSHLEMHLFLPFVKIHLHRRIM